MHPPIPEYPPITVLALQSVYVTANTDEVDRRLPGNGILIDLTDNDTTLETTVVDLRKERIPPTRPGARLVDMSTEQQAPTMPSIGGGKLNGLQCL